MKQLLRSVLRGGAGALLLTVAACAHGPSARPGPAVAPPTTPASEIDAIMLLLDRGDTGAAGKRIAAALKRDPGNASVQMLRDSITGDPKALLGPNSFPYVTRAGDTMPGLAERFLGNRLKAFELSRYNGITKPDTLMAGQLLRIPGEAPHAEEPVPARAEPHAAAQPAAPTKSKPQAAKPMPAKPPVANPAAAHPLRAAGLAALNAGNIGRAVVLLRRAAQLDPANPAITRDLARAERIAATVKAHR